MSVERKDIPETSQLKILKFYTHPDIRNGVKKFIDPLKLSDFKVEPSENDIYHSLDVVDFRRLDSLSYIYYGNIGYWWVIAMVNNVYDPYTDLEPGDTIRIPYFTNVLKALRDNRVFEEE